MVSSAASLMCLFYHFSYVFCYVEFEFDSFKVLCTVLELNNLGEIIYERFRYGKVAARRGRGGFGAFFL